MTSSQQYYVRTLPNVVNKNGLGISKYIESNEKLKPIDNLMSKNQWQDLIRSNKKSISDSSIRTYLSIIGSVCRDMGIESPKIDFFDKHYSEVLLKTKDLPFAKRKNILAAILSVTTDDKAKEQYRKTMMMDIQKYNVEQREQKLTDKQKDSWVSQEELARVYKEVERDAKTLMLKSKLNKHELKTVMKYVVLSCYYLIPPRRLLDYVSFKLRNYNKNDDNYMSGRSFVFNRYKTAKVYLQQKVNIGQKLHSIISRWSGLHDNDYLLFNSRNQPMTSSQLVLLLNDIFGKKASVNALRHSFLTEKVLKDVPLLTKLDDVAEEMGHSVSQALLYKKQIPK